MGFWDWKRRPYGWYWCRFFFFFFYCVFLCKIPVMEAEYSTLCQLGEEFGKKDLHSQKCFNTFWYFWHNISGGVMSLHSLGKENDSDTAFFEPLLCDMLRAKHLTDILLFVTTNLCQWTATPRAHLYGDRAWRTELTYPGVRLQEVAELASVPMGEPQPARKKHTLNWDEWSQIVTWLR